MHPPEDPKYLRIEINRRQLSLSLALAIVSIAALKLDSETLNLTTYYPSPVGNYLNIQANKVQFNKSYTLAGVDNTNVCKFNDPASPLAGPCVPAGKGTPPVGQVFYNGDQDGLFYASNKADPTDQSTWFQPVSGIASKTVGSMSIDSWAMTSSRAWKVSKIWYKSQWVFGFGNQTPANLSLVPASPWYYAHGWLRVPQTKSFQLDEVDANGVYCTSYTVTLQNIVAGGDTPQANPAFLLSRGHWSGGIYYGAVTLASSKITVDLTNVSGSYICGNFDISAILALGKGTTSNDYGMQFQADTSSDECAYAKAFHPCAVPPEYDYGWNYLMPKTGNCHGPYMTVPRPCAYDYISGVSLTVNQLLSF